MPFLVSVASVLHWFTGTAYTGFPGQTNSSVKTVFWRDCICIAAQCYWVLQDYCAPRWPDSLGNTWHGISLSRALWVEEGFSRWGLMLCNEGQFRGARGWCDSAVFPVPRAVLTQWFVCNTVTSLNKLIQMENDPSKYKSFTTYCPGSVPAQSGMVLPAHLGVVCWRVRGRNYLEHFCSKL